MNPLVLALALPGLAIPGGIQSTFPRQDEVLPTNAQPLLFTFTPEGEELEVVRVLADGSTVLLPSEDLGGVLRFDPGLLQPGSTLVVDARCPSCEASPVSFTVGDASDDVAPTFAPGAASNISILGFHTGGICPSAAGYEVGLTLPEIDEPVYVRLEGEDGPLRNDGSGSGLHFFVDGGEERTECYRAFALDGAGHETELDEDLCFELTHDLLEEPACCANTGGSTVPALVALMGFVRMRRRRQVPSEPRSAQ